jgi:putative hydrolase of the HAD superfamily
MNTDIDAVIFDFGGVLSSSVGDAMLSVMGSVGAPIEQLLPIMLGPLDEDGSHPWHRIERGEISAEAAFAEIIELGRQAGFENFPAPPAGGDLMTSLAPGTEMIAAARTVRAAGFKTAILTNVFHEAHDWRLVCGADELVDVIVESCEVGMRKPDPAIYQYTLEQLGGIAPERALFLDDFPWNITGARAAGLQTLHVADSPTAAGELLQRLAL